MISAGFHEAKTNLSRLIGEVEKGEEVYIKRGNKPVAKLVPCSDDLLKHRRPRVGDVTSAPVIISEDVFQPLTDSELSDWDLV